MSVTNLDENASDPPKIVKRTIAKSLPFKKKIWIRTQKPLTRNRVSSWLNLVKEYCKIELIVREYYRIRGSTNRVRRMIKADIWPLLGIWTRSLRTIHSQVVAIGARGLDAGDAGWCRLLGPWDVEHRLTTPYILGVLVDGPIRREFARRADVQQGLSAPFHRAGE